MYDSHSFPLVLFPLLSLPLIPSPSLETFHQAAKGEYALNSPVRLIEGEREERGKKKQA